MRADGDDGWQLVSAYPHARKVRPRSHRHDDGTRGQLHAVVKTNTDGTIAFPKERDDSVADANLAAEVGDSPRHSRAKAFWVDLYRLERRVDGGHLCQQRHQARIVRSLMYNASDGDQVRQRCKDHKAGGATSGPSRRCGTSLFTVPQPNHTPCRCCRRQPRAAAGGGQASASRHHPEHGQRGRQQRSRPPLGLQPPG